jgi:hypothetical protein
MRRPICPRIMGTKACASCGCICAVYETPLKQLLCLPCWSAQWDTLEQTE